MPLYDYVCLECKESFEELVFNSNDAKQICCSRCGSKKINKLVSLFGVAGTDKKVSTSSCTSCSSQNCSTCK
ncbi:MAG: zinc ribbon domain-containing protein [Candidatus Latescibacteria bacterium]|nr:zinc ribbon domain-containing protein [Candidatus Latescibacterota bacterium]